MKGEGGCEGEAERKGGRTETLFCFKTREPFFILLTSNWFTNFTLSWQKKKKELSKWFANFLGEISKPFVNFSSKLVIKNKRYVLLLHGILLQNGNRPYHMPVD